MKRSLSNSHTSDNFLDSQYCRVTPKIVASTQLCVSVSNYLNQDQFCGTGQSRYSDADPYDLLYGSGSRIQIFSIRSQIRIQVISSDVDPDPHGQMRIPIPNILVCLKMLQFKNGLETGGYRRLRLYLQLKQILKINELFQKKPRLDVVKLNLKQFKAYFLSELEQKTEPEPAYKIPGDGQKRTGSATLIMI